MRERRGYKAISGSSQRRVARAGRGGTALARGGSMTVSPSGSRTGQRAERRSMRDALQSDPQLRSRADDFVRRYTTGYPRQGYDDGEAAEMF